MKSYTRFMRVTKTEAILHEKFEKNPRLCVIRDHMTYRIQNDPAIREAIVRSFREAGEPCQWCDKCYEVGFETCLECKRRFVEGKLISK